MSDLPQTLEDAVNSTRQISYRYLCIDTLRIMQASSKDLVVKSMKMADVDGDATLTIVAEVAADTTTGVFASTNIFYQKQYD
ncbi:hypothetical protein MFRU_055g00250 [Monilinia fructicola]|uniref:Heterokaryon incompatibility domain-containing protein n=1 Tax=Monilinia fructicola TaxID=38448 RepID=A0A5M9JNZ9_MONFR|nr:hypothetical protein EYC84_000571 [Monilinia fructicola]KAG4025552.1 hypothetical protein MFRU_055g00250 [Monilinia fructicola]